MWSSPRSCLWLRVCVQYLPSHSWCSAQRLHGSTRLSRRPLCIGYNGCSANGNPLCYLESAVSAHHGVWYVPARGLRRSIDRYSPVELYCVWAWQPLTSTCELQAACRIYNKYGQDSPACIIFRMTWDRSPDFSVFFVGGNQDATVPLVHDRHLTMGAPYISAVNLHEDEQLTGLSVSRDLMRLKLPRHGKLIGVVCRWLRP